MFVCNQCGKCCRHLNNANLYKELDRGDGTCKYLVQNLCSIYDNRPLLCRVDESYEVFFKNHMSKDEYYMMNYDGCETIKRLKEEI